MSPKQLLANLRLAEAAHLSAQDVGRRRSAAQTVLAEAAGITARLEIDEDGFINLVATDWLE